ncbi:hypothetical protein, partial [Bythopirellula polymerisocia]|uniref:hypothetical protein n=1 Tax=Bythopirellula polymerisocia TaxID=2528003 RepID=UPI0011B4A6EF
MSNKLMFLGFSMAVDASPARGALTAEVIFTDGSLPIRFGAEDQVALGDYSPRAPTDPYVPALEHTVPQIMVSLRDEAANELRV